MLKKGLKDLAHLAIAVFAAMALATAFMGMAATLWYTSLAVLVLAGYMVSEKLHHITLTSAVVDHEGPCVPVWLNKNEWCVREVGAVTGCFRTAKKLPLVPYYVASGPEFHGYIKADNTVETTEGHFHGLLPM